MTDYLQYVQLILLPMLWYLVRIDKRLVKVETVLAMKKELNNVIRPD